MARFGSLKDLSKIPMPPPKARRHGQRGLPNPSVTIDHPTSNFATLPFFPLLFCSSILR